MTPPKVLGAPKPWSSVMISSTLGAPFGGTTRGGHQAFDSEAFSPITPPNFGSGGGSCFPSSVMVAPGEPGHTCALLSQCRDATQGEKTRACQQAATDFHSGSSRAIKRDLRTLAGSTLSVLNDDALAKAPRTEKH